MAQRRGHIRYAVVGLGHIAQVAVLPAFAHAKRNSRLVALVSDDRAKRRTMATRYGVEATFSYDDYDACLEQVDAVYIALPNSLHAEYSREADDGIPAALRADQPAGDRSRAARPHR
jgi:predicted dehydrogenase